MLKAQDSPKEEKGKWMWRHKSMGLLAGIIIAPRFAYRLMNRKAYNVEKIAGSGAGEHKVGQLAHYALYSFMTIMPATGIAMGYFGGTYVWLESVSFLEKSMSAFANYFHRLQALVSHSSGLSSTGSSKPMKTRLGLVRLPNRYEFIGGFLVWFISKTKAWMNRLTGVLISFYP